MTFRAELMGQIGTEAEARNDPDKAGPLLLIVWEGLTVAQLIGLSFLGDAGFSCVPICKHVNATHTRLSLSFCSVPYHWSNSESQSVFCNKIITHTVTQAWTFMIKPGPQLVLIYGFHLGECDLFIQFPDNHEYRLHFLGQLFSHPSPTYFVCMFLYQCVCEKATHTLV